MSPVIAFIPTSDLEREVACIKASLDQIFRQSFIPCCLSLQNCQGTVSSTISEKIWILNTITQTSTKKATPKKTEMRSGPKYSQEFSACVKNGYNIIATDGVRFLFKKKPFEKGKKPVG